MRKTRPTALAIVVLLMLSLLAACAPKQPVAQKAEPAVTPPPVVPAEIRLGNLPTEDILPLWVAQQKGMFDQAGIKVTIVPFQSAQERDAAYTAGAIDGFMGDPIAVGELNDAGFKTRIVSVCLGATAAEGRFGIVSSRGSGIRSAKALKNVPIGTSSGTVQEYVLDGLMAQAGVTDSGVKKEEVKKVPVRFQLLMGGQIKAAALPEPFLSLAVKQGARLVADDTKGKNLSQTVLAFSQNYLAKPEGAEAANRLLAVWDQGAAEVNASPDAYRQLLTDKARLPKEVASTYKINNYPTHQLPAEADIAAVLDWMQQQGLLKTPLAYTDMTWAPGQTVEPSVSPSEAATPSATTTTP